MTVADDGCVFAAPAKINLTLHVTGRRADGYHLLDSLVVFAEIADRLSYAPGRGMSLKLRGPMTDGVPQDGRNLVMKAARLAGIRDAAITLEKHLPSAAGIGGGTSDAAALLRAAGRSLSDPLALGADLPVCLLARPARMRGVGEDVTPLSGIPDMAAVLVNPGVALATPAMFAALARRDGAPMPAQIPAFADAADCAAWIARQRNDLEPPAIATHPVIAQALGSLRAAQALVARMSGSGATVFGLFTSDAAARDAAQMIAGDAPGWWVRATRFRGSDRADGLAQRQARVMTGERQDSRETT